VLLVVWGLGIGDQAGAAKSTMSVAQSPWPHKPAVQVTLGDDAAGSAGSWLFVVDPLGQAYAQNQVVQRYFGSVTVGACPVNTGPLAGWKIVLEALTPSGFAETEKLKHGDPVPGVGLPSGVTLQEQSGSRSASACG
jgi:hypothetical protein